MREYRVLHSVLTHWGRVTHICVSTLTIIDPDNGLSPRRRQAIIWSNAGILLTGTLGTNFIKVLSEFHTFSFMKMHLKMSSGKWRPFCLGLNVLWTSVLRPLRDWIHMVIIIDISTTTCFKNDILPLLSLLSLSLVVNSGTSDLASGYKWAYKTIQFKRNKTKQNKAS